MSDLLSLSNEIKENLITSPNLLSSINIFKTHCHNNWKEYVQFNSDKYNRIRIITEDNFEIILICWKKGQKSKIHDHPENGCLMKLLEGNLCETRYIREGNKMIKTCSNNILIDNVSFISGSHGLHDIEAIDDSVSLHIYSPPLYKPNYFI